MVGDRSIRIFVAMPFSTMGENAPWSDVNEIRREFLEPISREIGERLGVSVKLVIEDEKTSTGNIHRSMFSEAVDVDIYIRLKVERAEDLVKQAANLKLEKAINVLRSAVDKNPVSFVAHFQLGAHLTKAGQYAEAAEALERATRLDSSSPEAWRELGVAYSKDEKLDEATTALEESLNRDSGHHETWSNLGGVRRRKSRRGGRITDWGELRKSLEAYDKAVAHKPTDSYAQFNAALLDLMLTLHERRDDRDAIERFRKLQHLCRWEVLEWPSDGWKRLNLSGTLAVLADKDEAVAEVHRLWQATPEAAKKSYSDSAIPPLRDLLQTGGLTPEQADAIKAVVSALERQGG